MNRVSPGELWLQVAPEWVLNLPDGLEDLIYRFYRSLIYDNRYEMYFEGLKNTLLLTFFALMIGIVLGVIVALIRVTWDKNGSEMTGFSKIALKIANAICQVYLTVIRGTPVIVQVKTENTLTKQLKGVKINCLVSVKNKGETVATDNGEVLFCDYGQY